jgi:hypothetical protein
LGVLALCVSVHAADIAQQNQDAKLIGISRISELPPLPANLAKGNSWAQPLDVPVPIFSRHQDGFEGSVATGVGTAIVFRQAYDSGYGNFNKSTQNNFAGNLMSLGNGFPADGGDITGYDLLIYNSVTSPGGDATAYVSLWDGDPLGFIDTRVSDPPQEITGTDCTFSGLTKAGLGSNGCVNLVCDGGFLDGTACTDDSDCGLCPAISGDDIPECPGLWRLQCDFGGKVAIPSRNVWMIVQWLDGCRMGWRRSIFAPPQIAAVGVYNFCGPPGASSCEESSLPCSDLAIELVDAESQYSGLGVGTCCEDDTIACDHTDADTSNDCAHATTCSDGVADYFSAWCYGAEVYWASWVASIYTNTDTLIKVVPRGADANNSVHDVKPSDDIPFDVWVSGWDSDGDGVPVIKVWQTQIDSGTYGSDYTGSLTNRRPPCTANGDCSYNPEGELCYNNYCAGAWQQCPNEDPDHQLCLDLPACDVSSPDPRCGSTYTGLNPNHTEVVDEGLSYYAMSLALSASADFAGCADVGLIPDPSTFLKDHNSLGIPLVGYVPGTYCVDIGQCCDFDQDPVACADHVTANECAAFGGETFTVGKTCADPCECDPNVPTSFDDGDACTDDSCVDGIPTHVDNFDDTVSCCDPASGALCDLDDGDQCTADTCENGNRGGCVHTITPDVACDDGRDCDTVNDTCQEDGTCVGTSISDFTCTVDADCEAVDPAASCNTFLGVCICQLPELTCDISGSDKPNEACVTQGDKVTVDVYFQFTPQNVAGAQFGLSYDPTCMDFVSIAPGGDPYVFEIKKIVDEAAGYIFYAVGVDPFGGTQPVSGQAVLATASFIKIGDCNSCGIDIVGTNPQDVTMADDTGQPISVIPVPCGPVYDNSGVHLDVPDGDAVNADCDTPTAVVDWDPPTAWSDCYDADLVCSGSHESGYQYPNDVVMNGGELLAGTSTFCCTATDTFCGDETSDCWTVDVSDESTFDVTLQLSPTMAGDVTRCITFELFADCVSAPIVVQDELLFGGLWDFVGHFTDAKKIPAGANYFCVTAMDQQHSLRATASMACVDGVYQAEFKGDPFNGGNWLVQGNLDGWKKENPAASHDAIDIYDFAQFVAMYGQVFPIDTTCAEKHTPNGDINGDGIVDALDFAFIMQNFLAVSKDACCPDAAASVVGRTSVSVRELRQTGNGDLVVADLNNDGVVDSVDMNAFANGATINVKPERNRGNSLRTNR